MKKNIQSILFTLLTIILLALLVSIIIGFLYTFNFLISSLSMISKGFGFLIIIIAGFLFGKNIKEKTFIYAFCFALFGFLLCFIFTQKELISILLLACKWFLFIIMSMIGRST